MSEDYHAIRWVEDNIATRKTKEVDLKCEIIKTIGNAQPWIIRLEGVADHEHHLVEDAAILLKKMAQVKCGGDH